MTLASGVRVGQTGWQVSGYVRWGRVGQAGLWVCLTAASNRMDGTQGCLSGIFQATPTTAREDGLGVTVKDNHNNNKII